MGFTWAEASNAGELDSNPLIYQDSTAFNPSSTKDMP
jgi:hypothetical protein